MKSFLVIVLMTGFVSAQTIYKVIPGTKDNKIILTIENASNETEMTDIKAWVSKQLSALNFQLSEQTIDKIEKQASKDVEFVFDVNRAVEVNKIDTLMFTINNGTGAWIKEILLSYETPKEFKLEQNYPNPFNPETKISYQVPSACKITLKIYDVLGREVATLIDEKQEPGYYEKIFTAKNLASGMYIYRLSGGNVNLVKKMILMK